MQSKLPQADFRARRRQLANQLPPNSIAVISGAHEIIRNGDSHYRFRQDSHFYYLTGFDEPDALLVITSGMQSQSILFNRPRMALEEQWTGPRLGQEEAVHVLGVDAAYPYASIETMLLELLIGVTQIFYPIGQNPIHQRCLLDAWLQIKGLSRRGSLAPHALVDLTPLLSEMRLIKDDIELTLMRKAAQGSVAAHLRAMRSVRHSPYEYSLLAEFYDEMLSLGLLSVAYEPIVAGGERACVLHYTANNQPLNAGDLVLVDAGAECGYYAADITRSYPVNGRFNTEQRLIYSLVLDAQAAGIATIKPGVAWSHIQSSIVSVLTSGLVDLGLLKGKVDELIASEAYKPFYMHSSGHWLGLDVHDVGAYSLAGASRPLLPGMVLTVEPGLYIKPGMPGVDSRWWGIGVRIEDDIVVTEAGFENLSAALPSSIDSLEDLLNE